MKKVGIMGGTFNPIHNGHLFLAENALEQLNLDQILFMPSKNPPHKEKTEFVSDECRTDMVSLAIQDNSNYSLSMIELEREGVTYTADTLTLLTKENPDTEYYFIVGADSLFMMQTWKNPQTIFDLSTILVSDRNHSGTEQLDKHAKYLNETFRAHIIILEMPTIEISSVNIRERIAMGKSIRYYVPKEVLVYITKHRLYDIVPEE